MALTALYVLVGIVAIRQAALLGSLYALGVHNGRGGVGVLADPLPLNRTEDRKDALPQPPQTELSEMIVDGGPWREVTG